MLKVGTNWNLYDTPFILGEVSTPATAIVDTLRLYAKDKAGTSALYYMDDAGGEKDLSGGITGTGASGRVAFWTGATTLSSDADLTFSVDTLTVTKLIAPTSVTISALTLGSVLFASTAGLISQDNANFFWDDTNNRLGIGTATPLAALHLSSATAALAKYRVDRLTTSPGSFSGFSITGSATVANAFLAFFGGGGSHDGTAANAAETSLLGVYAGELWTSTAKGSYLTLETTPLLSTTRAERFRIGPSGQWGIGGATFGTALDVFTSGGASAAPTWTAPGALTKVDDTNVTLTLGGTPTTALLRAASLTLGWTGTLAVARGGIGVGTLAAHGVLIGNGTGAVQVTSAGTAGQVLTSNGASADPTFQAVAASGNFTIGLYLALPQVAFKL